MTHDLQQLIIVIATTEQGLAADHLRKDTPDRPYIDRCTIRSRPHEDVGRAIPKRHDLIRKGVDRNTKSTRKTKITNLQLAFSIDEQLSSRQSGSRTIRMYTNILRLQITMQDPVLVAECNTFA